MLQIYIDTELANISSVLFSQSLSKFNSIHTVIITGKYYLSPFCSAVLISGTHFYT